MKNVLLSVIFLFLLASCGAKKGPTILSSTSNPTQMSSDYEPFVDVTDYAQNEEYGLKGKFPVKIGGRSAVNQRRYLASLAGPNGEELSFHRRGSCCGYKSENGLSGVALVDVYEVMYDGLEDPILVFISFYDLDKLYIPKGFTKRNL